MGLYCTPRDCYCLLLPAVLPVVYPRCSSLSPRVCTSPPTSHTAHLALPHRVEKHAVSRRSCSMGSQWGHESESGLRGISCRGLGYEMVRVRVETTNELQFKHHENLPSMSVRASGASRAVGASLWLHRSASLDAPRPRIQLRGALNT